MLYKPMQGRVGGIYWYLLQTHSAAEIVFNRYWDMNRMSRVNRHGDLVRDRGLLKCKPNESEKFCTLINDAKVFFKSGDNFDDLRTETLDGGIIDEMRQQNAKLWPTVVAPMLTRRNGWADIYSTPNGFDHFYDLFEEAKLNPDWAWFHAPSTEAWWWTPEQIAIAKSTMSEAEFAQEILAEFREMAVGKVYINHGAWNQAAENPFAIRGYPWAQQLPICIGLDFNVGLMCWELGQFRGRDCYFGDEIAVPNTNTQECAKILVEKVRGHKPGVVLVGDASGNSRKTSASGETDYSIIKKALREADIQCRDYTPDANPQVKDRVNVVNASLKDASGTPHLFYNLQRCPRLKRDFERVTWKNGSGEAIFDKSDPLLTHPSDAAGYPIYHFCNELKSRPGKLHVLVR